MRSVKETIRAGIQATASSELKRALAKHRTETEGQVARLEKVFAAIDKKPQSKTCDVIVGITNEGAEIMKEIQVLTCSRRRSARSGASGRALRNIPLTTWANELGLSAAARLLDEPLAEEKKADVILTEIAETGVNQAAEAA